MAERQLFCPSMTEFLSILLGFALLLSLSILAPPPAAAAQTGDMFYDQGYTDPSRPSVPGDRPRGADVFQTEPYMRTDKDMFDHTHPPGTFGGEDMFNPQTRPVPDEPLFNWPKDRPAP